MFKKKMLIIYSPPCYPRCPCLLSFFSRKEMKVFDENIPGFFYIVNIVKAKQYDITGFFRK